MAQTSLPAGFGGLMRYNEEYNSRFKFKPSSVIIFVILVVLLVLGLKIFLPI